MFLETSREWDDNIETLWFVSVFILFVQKEMTEKYWFSKCFKCFVI